ncbi:MAG: hypothetical protein OXH99_00535 [Bryobacterales bacterium]|nr:hypothetical protein [Bryobacterales bacterium]
MRTTLNLSAEAMAKVRLLAQQRDESPSAVASELILKALEPREVPRIKNGIPLFPTRLESKNQSAAPDLELVNRLRDQE